MKGKLGLLFRMQYPKWSFWWRGNVEKELELETTVLLLNEIYSLRVLD